MYTCTYTLLPFSVAACMYVRKYHMYIYTATEMHSKVYVCTCVNVELLDTAVCGGVCSCPVAVMMGAYPSKAVM